MHRVHTQHAQSTHTKMLCAQTLHSHTRCMCAHTDTVETPMGYKQKLQCTPRMCAHPYFKTHLEHKVQCAVFTYTQSACICITGWCMHARTHTRCAHAHTKHTHTGSACTPYSMHACRMHPPPHACTECTPTHLPTCMLTAYTQ